MRSLLWTALLASLFAAPAAAQKRVLFVNHSAGFRHDSTVTAATALDEIARRDGRFEVTATEDVSLLNAEYLSLYDAVFFFTSGELPISDQQKQDLLDFVRSGKGFGGAHSATDTLYGWADYGDMIGAYFDGHPWATEARVNVEDAEFPGMAPLTPSFSIVDEFYQFRQFSRDKVRVLMTLDTSTVDLQAPGIKRTDGDFALAWIRQYGDGRVFYTALGHFEWNWMDERFQSLLEGAMLWLTGLVEADATPRPAPDRDSCRDAPSRRSAPDFPFQAADRRARFPTAP